MKPSAASATPKPVILEARGIHAHFTWGMSHYELESGTKELVTTKS